MDSYYFINADKTITVKNIEDVDVYYIQLFAIEEEDTFGYKPTLIWVPNFTGTNNVKELILSTKDHKILDSMDNYAMNRVFFIIKPWDDDIKWIWDYTNKNSVTTNDDFIIYPVYYQIARYGSLLNLKSILTLLYSSNHKERHEIEEYMLYVIMSKDDNEDEKYNKYAYMVSQGAHINELITEPTGLFNFYKHTSLLPINYKKSVTYQEYLTALRIEDYSKYIKERGWISHLPTKESKRNLISIFGKDFPVLTNFDPIVVRQYADSYGYDVEEPETIRIKDAEITDPFSLYDDEEFYFNKNIKLRI